MIVGFTGTRSGCTTKQYDALKKLLTSMTTSDDPMKALHHGACVGADADAARIARGLGVTVVAHPEVSARVEHGHEAANRSREAMEASDEVLPEQTHFARNREIVQACDVLVACPRTNHEESQGGTWFTVVQARRAGKRVVIVWPDGSVEEQPR